MNYRTPEKGGVIAVIAAHPDDEVLGCGGTIARHAAAGDRVHVLIMAEGVTSRTPVRDRAEAGPDLARLEACARDAHAILGTAELVLLNFADNRMDSVDLLEVVKAAENFLERVKPSRVYTHFPQDLNIDHRVVSEAVQTACRPIPGAAIEEVLFFEVASSSDWRMASSCGGFNPNCFIRVDETLDLKLRALASYGPEMRPWPHARSIEASRDLARWRGALVGCGAAEAFVVGRRIER